MAKDAAQRKREQREREAKHLEAMDASKLEMVLYKGTREALERIMTRAGFEEQEEAVTVLIHNLDKLKSCDSHVFEKLTDVAGLRKG